MDIITLSFGAMAEPVADQLARQGISYPPGCSGEWDRWIAATARLAVHGIITTAERNRAERRIMKAIIRDIRDYQTRSARLVNHREVA